MSQPGVLLTLTNQLVSHTPVITTILFSIKKKNSGIHRNVSGIVLLEYLLYYIFTLIL